jgi:purine-nucleoside/S-methyl-5'-thioadenosine phosphorylase / adenosine deaminase
MTLPPVPETFHWTHEAWGAALKCRPLDEAAQHLFTTRQLELPSRESWQKLAPSAGVPPDRFVTLNQVHGRRVITIPRGMDDAALMAMQTNRPDADGLVSAEPDIALVVRAADCVPLLMADRRTGAVAAVHAGWRGTAARVAVAAIETMGREFGTRPADVVVAVGPAIRPCCYEVGTDVVDAFASAGHERYLIERWFLAPPAPRGGFRPVPDATDGPRLRLDVPGANRDQLMLAGVPEDNIHLAGLCTSMHLDVLTSYRAEKERAVRIAGVIRASEARN